MKSLVVVRAPPTVTYGAVIETSSGAIIGGAFRFSQVHKTMFIRDSEGHWAVLDCGGWRAD